jgi:diguanylate cyclase (GGDEF)-like protein
MASGSGQPPVCFSARRAILYRVTRTIALMPEQEPQPPGFVEDESGAQDDLRRRVSTLLLNRADIVAADSLSVFPFGSYDNLDAEYCRRVGHLLVELLGFAVRDGRVDARGGFVADLYRVTLERTLTIDQLFNFVYLTERTALDELALDQMTGATSEPWPVVAQLLRRASFDLLAAYTERSRLEPTGAAIIDRLTTLYTRPVLDAAIGKAVDRAGRFGEPLSLILFDVDNLSEINSAHGYGVGDRILERLGILIRGFFRQYDWIARHADDSIAVLLTRTEAADAAELAERVVATVQERLASVDHRTDQPWTVAVSAAVVNVTVAIGDAIDGDRLMADAEAALDRAKRAGRNRVERVDGYSGKKPAAL